jgi:two-component system sensor histidine kinase CiaH
VTTAPESSQHLLRRQSIRVALAAAAIVAGAYLAIGVGVYAISSTALVAQMDDRVLDGVGRILHDPRPAPPGGYEPQKDKPLGPFLYVWTFHPDGATFTNFPSSPELPVDPRAITTPRTVNVDGTNLRLAGNQIGSRYVVAGESMDQIEDAQSTITTAMVLIAPFLIGAVFLGAVLIGRRVAAPIEAARRRQLEFTADASHELRTPLSVIEAHTSLALAADRSPEWYRRAFEKIEPEGRRMRHLLDDLLWLARFDASRGAPNAEPVDVATLAAQAVDRFGPVAEARHLTLAVDAGPGAHVVSVPPEWLDRLLGVLLDNAVRYSPEGGTISVRVEPDGSRVRLAVDDSGPGIAPDERERIFDRFHRANEKPGGAGLGLAIADAIVRATNGRWRIGTSAAGGASMSVSWPRALSAQAEPGVPATRTSVASSD